MGWTGARPRFRSTGPFRYIHPPPLCSFILPPRFPMSLVNCPACGATVSSEAPACPHCGHPRPGMPVAPPPSRGISPGLLILGIVVVGALVVGLLGFGVYRVLQRVNPPGERHPEELVDFVDSAAAPGARGEAPPDSIDPNETPAQVRGNVSGPPPGDSTFELSAVESPPELL